MKKRVSKTGICILIVSGLTGVGFSSGQEIFSFFGSYGKFGILGVILFPLLLCSFMYMYIQIARRKNTGSYSEILTPVDFKSLSLFIDALITFFMCVVVVSLAAAAGTLLNQLTQIPEFVGSLLVCMILIAASFLKSSESISKFIKPVVYFFLICVVIICILILMKPLQAQSTIQREGSAGGALFSALLYLSYNMLVLIGVISPVAKKLDTDKSVFICCVVCSVIMGALVAIQFFALLKLFPSGHAFDLPLAYGAGLLWSKFGVAYKILMLIAAMTTAISCYSGLLGRVKKINQIKKIPYPLFNIILTAIIFVLSLIGFVNVVNIIYPVIGALGILVLILLIISFFRRNRNGTGQEKL